jgi:succinate-semialdehyde dehydrogenase/glutarate-semialdehyde dehydrogenase
LKKSVLELGGSDAFVVLEDADLHEAARVGVNARFQNAGQSCIAAKRFIVVESVADEFEELFSRTASELRVGDPVADGIEMGPMARARICILAARSMKTASTAASSMLGQATSCP